MYKKRTSYLSIVPAVLLLATACKRGGDGKDTGDEDAEGSESDSTGATTNTDASATADGTGDTSEPETGMDSVTADGTDDTSPDTTDTSGSDTGVDTGDTGAGGGGLEELVEALCMHEFDCCSAGELTYRLGPFTTDATVCTDRFMQLLANNDNDYPIAFAGLLGMLGNTVRLDRADVNDAAIPACIAAVKAWECAKLLDPDGRCEPGDTADPCALDKLFTGKLGAGDSCTPFMAVDIECGPGTKCVESSKVTAECRDRAAVDKACDGADDCDDGLYCDLAAGKCVAQGDVDDACEFDDPLVPTPGTETKPCLSHLTCNPDTSTCTAFCTDGYTCESDVHCPEGMSCVPESPGSAFKYCGVPGGPGDPCDTKDDCMNNHYCAGENCDQSVAIGDPCSTDEECVTGYCSLINQCTNFEGVDDPCNRHEECDPDDTVGCYTSNDGTLCRAALLPNGDACSTAEGSCNSGICDFTLSGYECMAGGGADDPCDDSTLTTDTFMCAPEFYCDPTDAVCLPKAGAGQDCMDDMSLQCLGMVCDETDPWGDPICTDAPESSTQVTCDGAR